MMSTVDEIKKFIENNDLGELVYLRSCRGHYKTLMKDLFWWRIEFSEELRQKLRPEYAQFEGLHLTPYLISEETISAIRENVETAFDNKAVLPNLDPISGNIHPANKIPDRNNCKVMQAVLVRRHANGAWGPLGYSMGAGLDDRLFAARTLRSQYYPQPNEAPLEDSSAESILNGAFVRFFTEQIIGKTE